MADITPVAAFWVHACILATTLVVVALRIYVRTFMVKAMAADDWILVLATTMFTVTLALQMRGTAVGAFSQDHGPMSPALFEKSLKSAYACQVLYPPISLAIRVSVCLFLLKIVNTRLHRVILYTLLGLVSAASAVYLTVTVFQCLPPSYFWSRILEPDAGSCLNLRAVAIAGLVHGAVSALSACVVGVLPMFILWKIRMNLRTKITLIVLLGMSIFACVALVVRMTTLSDQMPSQKSFHSVMTTALWSMIEPAVGIIAACLPTLRPLFKKMSRGSSNINPAPNSGTARVNRRRRASTMKQYWAEVSTHNVRDPESDAAESRMKQSMSARWRNATLFGGGTEVPEVPELPVPQGISVHTAIEVTVSSRESSSAGEWGARGLEF